MIILPLVVTNVTVTLEKTVKEQLTTKRAIDTPFHHVDFTICLLKSVKRHACRIYSKLQ